MTDSKEADAYEIAFKVGFVGIIILSFFGAVVDLLLAAIALAVWNLSVLFLLPWIYLWYCNRDFAISMEMLRRI